MQLKHSLLRTLTSLPPYFLAYLKPIIHDKTFMFWRFVNIINQLRISLQNAIIINIQDHPLNFSPPYEIRQKWSLKWRFRFTYCVSTSSNTTILLIYSYYCVPIPNTLGFITFLLFANKRKVKNKCVRGKLNELYASARVLAILQSVISFREVGIKCFET